MANFRVLFLCAALVVGCALVFPRSAASMGGKPDSPATSDIQAGSDGPSKPAADSAEAPAAAAPTPENSNGKTAAGTPGGQHSGVMNDGREPAPVDPGNALGLMGLGMPSMAIGGTEDALSPVGGMGSMGTGNCFPPFFGGGTPQTRPQ